MWRCDVLEGFPVILPEKWWRWWGVYRWESEEEECVYVCCVERKWKRKEQEWEWPAKERKERIVRYVVGEDGLGGAHVGLKKNPTSFFSFFFFLSGLGHYTASIEINGSYAIQCIVKLDINVDLLIWLPKVLV